MAIDTVQLKPETRSAFDEYVCAAETAMERTLKAARGFLWVEGNAGRVEQVRKGKVVAERWNDPKSSDPVAVPDGLIHDWIGAAFVPDCTVQQALALVQDYDNHKNVYKPEVIESGVISHSGDEYDIYLRLLKKKIITVVLDTYHHAQYGRAGSHRAWCHSHSTSILEVERAGTPREYKLAPDCGYGFMWRLYSYWRFEEKDGGLFFECRAISLSRDVPTVLAWIINPIVRKLPKESLINTLEATRKGLQKQKTEARSQKLTT